MHVHVHYVSPINLFKNMDKFDLLSLFLAGVVEALVVVERVPHPAAVGGGGDLVAGPGKVPERLQITQVLVEGLVVDLAGDVVVVVGST